MPTVTLDTIDNSDGSLGAVASQVGRGFIVTNMPTEGMAPSDLLPSVLQYLPGFNTAHPSGQFPTLKMTRVEVRGVLPDAVSGRLLYTPIDGGGNGSAYVLTRSSRTVQMSGSILPDGTIIDAAYDPQGGSSDPKQSVPFTPIIMNFRRPCTQLIAEGIAYGQQNYQAADYVGFVNDGTWQNRKTGSWLLDDFTTSYAKYANTTSFRAVALGNVLGRTWASVGLLRSTMTGRLITWQGMQAAIKQDLDADYAYGVSGLAHGGYAVVCPYPTINFNSIGL